MITKYHFDNIIITSEYIKMTLREREFFAYFKYFPELLEAPLYALFNVEYSAWESEDWHYEDSVYWEDINFGMHSRNLLDQSFNEGRLNERPIRFRSQIVFVDNKKLD
jgi:hypothetical protein